MQGILAIQVTDTFLGIIKTNALISKEKRYQLVKHAWIALYERKVHDRPEVVKALWLSSSAIKKQSTIKPIKMWE